MLGSWPGSHVLTSPHPEARNPVLAASAQRVKINQKGARLPSHYLGAADGFSTNVLLCQSPVNLGKFIFLVASVFYNGSFNLFLLCLWGFLLSGVFRLLTFFFFPVEVRPLMMTGLGICLSANLTWKQLLQSGHKAHGFSSVHFHLQLNLFASEFL